MITHTWDEETVAIRDKKTRTPGFFKDPSTARASKKVVMPDSLPGRDISARIFPNGEFGVGFVPHRGISAKERRYDSERRYADNNAEIIADIQIDDSQPEGFIYTRKIIPGTPPKLGIGTKSSQPSGRYGLKGITGYGRKMVRNAGTVLDKAFKGKYNRLLQMGTLTIPSYSPGSMQSICYNWGDIVRRFFQECKRQYARFRYPFHYVSVTEIQPKRLRERAEVGLHLHFLFCAVRLGKGKWVMSDTWVRKTWERIIKSYLAFRDASQLPNYRRDSVSKSSAAYLSKYMSKGGEQIHQVVDNFGESWLPSQWWSMDTQTRKCIKQYTIVSQGTVAEKLLVISRWGVGDYIRYIRCITLQINLNEYAQSRGSPSEIVLGYGGLLTSDGLGLFTPRDYFASIEKLLPRTIGRNNRYFKKYDRPRLTTDKRTS